jgi:hypothetical protein
VCAACKYHAGERPTFTDTVAVRLARMQESSTAKTDILLIHQSDLEI